MTTLNPQSRLQRLTIFGEVVIVVVIVVDVINLIPVLCKLFNESLAKGTFVDLKTADIIHTIKDHKLDAKNFKSYIYLYLTSLFWVNLPKELC